MRKVLSLLLIVLVGTTAAIAQEADPIMIEVLPAETIINEPLTMTNIGDTSAQMAVTTGIPMACVMVYGETPEFGNLILDSLMGLSAHDTHEIILTDLKPDTEYYYRVQGSDEAGNLYRSETYTFRTLPASDLPNDNLLSPENGAKITGISSVFGDGPMDGPWGGLNAVDNNLLTAWSSDGDGNNAWIEIELAQRSHIDQIGFQTRTMSNNTAEISTFTVTTDDGEVYGPFELTGAQEMDVFDVDFDAKTLRFDAVDSNGGNTGAIDIAAYGEALEE